MRAAYASRYIAIQPAGRPAGSADGIRPWSTYGRRVRKGSLAARRIQYGFHSVERVHGPGECLGRSLRVVCRLIRGLRTFLSKRDQNPPKKHGNIPL